MVTRQVKNGLATNPTPNLVEHPPHTNYHWHCPPTFSYLVIINITDTRQCLLLLIQRSPNLTVNAMAQTSVVATGTKYIFLIIS